MGVVAKFKSLYEDAMSKMTLMTKTSNVLKGDAKLMKSWEKQIKKISERKKGDLSLSKEVKDLEKHMAPSEESPKAPNSGKVIKDTANNKGKLQSAASSNAKPNTATDNKQASKRAMYTGLGDDYQYGNGHGHGHLIGNGDVYYPQYECID